MGRRAAVLTLVTVFSFGTLAACASDDDPGGGETSAGVTTSPTKASPQAASAGDAVGTWGEPNTTGKPSLTLAEDGTATGNDGCNQLSGTWEAGDDGSVTFSPFAATQMFCEGVDTWLSMAASATVDGDQLVVLDASDKQIGTLAKSS
ncbi:META domain-containing protein [Cellulomonas sp.]|uniref:META domain-containing protein n=1 Tax=Cellulomonas sp. TaxID=40001 RepID=UPI001AFFCCE6|nr:META domain-containing protein [Cellulomonas sp.]MBO9554809.1 META domain-containing protein [Cellulomonas sp.]